MAPPWLSGSGWKSSAWEAPSGSSWPLELYLSLLPPPSASRLPGSSSVCQLVNISVCLPARAGKPLIGPSSASQLIRSALAHLFLYSLSPHPLPLQGSRLLILQFSIIQFKYHLQGPRSQSIVLSAPSPADIAPPTPRGLNTTILHLLIYTRMRFLTLCHTLGQELSRDRAE